MKQEYMSLLRHVNRETSSGHVKFETNLGMMGEGVPQKPKEEVQDVVMEELNSIEELVEKLFSGSDNSEPKDLLTPDEIDEILMPFLKKSDEHVQPIASMIQKAIEDSNGKHPQDYYSMSSILVKIVEFNTLHMLDKLNVGNSPAMIEYALKSESTLIPQIERITELMKADDLPTQKSAINHFFLLIAEQLTGLQITLSFLDKMREDIKKKAEEQNGGN